MGLQESPTNPSPTPSPFHHTALTPAFILLFEHTKLIPALKTLCSAIPLSEVPRPQSLYG